MTVTALEITGRSVAASPTAGEAVALSDPATITVERVYHEDRRSGASWTHGLGDPCKVARCVGTGSFSGLKRYRPEAPDA